MITKFRTDEIYLKYIVFTFIMLSGTQHGHNIPYTVPVGIDFFFKSQSKNA